MHTAPPCRPLTSLLSTCAVAAAAWLVPTGPIAALQPPVQLSGPSISAASVVLAEISPDGKYVVYVQDAEIDDAFRVYSVPIGGGSPTVLTPHPKTNNAVPRFVISPDSTRVVIKGVYSTASRWDLYSIPITGPSLLLTSLATDVQTDVQITPDGARVVFRSDFDGDGQLQIVTVPITGPSSAAAPVTEAPYPEPTALLGITPNSSRAVFSASNLVPPKVMSVVLYGGPSTPVDLSPTDYFGTDSEINFLRLTPDGSRIVYVWKTSSSATNRLYSAPVAGPAGSAVRIDPVGYPIFYESFTVSPDGGTIGYRSGPGTNLYSVLVPTAGPSSAAQVVSYVGGSTPEVCPDNSTVVYQERSGDTYRLYSLQLGSPVASRVELSRDPGSGAGVDSFKVEPFGRQVVYLGDNAIPGWPMGFRVATSGPAGQDETIWLRPLIELQRDFVVTPNGSAVVLVGVEAFGSAPNNERIWAVPLVGQAYPDAWELSPIALSEPIVFIGISPDSKWAVYTADTNVPLKKELFAVEIPVTFADDFETGDTSVWSSTAP